MCTLTILLLAAVSLWIVLTADDGQSYEGCASTIVELGKWLLVLGIVGCLCILFSP